MRDIQFTLGNGHCIIGSLDGNRAHVYRAVQSRHIGKGWEDDVDTWVIDAVSEALRSGWDGATRTLYKPTPTPDVAVSLHGGPDGGDVDAEPVAYTQVTLPAGVFADLLDAGEGAYAAFVSCEPFDRIDASIALRAALDAAQGTSTDAP